MKKCMEYEVEGVLCNFLMLSTTVHWLIDVGQES